MSRKDESEMKRIIASYEEAGYEQEPHRQPSGTCQSCNVCNVCSDHRVNIKKAGREKVREEKPNTK